MNEPVIGLATPAALDLMQARPDHSAWRRIDRVAPGRLRPAAGCGKGDEQGTPLWLFDVLDAEFGFDCDLFASHENALCPVYHTIDRPWDATSPARVAWANPPFSAGAIGKAMQTCADAIAMGGCRTVVVLHRLEPGARWLRPLQDFLAEVRLLDVRLRFRGQTDSYNFPCAVSVLRHLRWSRSPHIDTWDVGQYRPRNAI